MCGRFTLKTSRRAIIDEFGPLQVPELSPRYNIAPTQDVAAIQLRDGAKQLSMLHWGLIPSWASDPSIGNRMINARAETVAEKPAYRSAFKRGRCLILADGFYEWMKVGKTKQPYYARLAGGRPFAFAGLSEHWHRDGQVIDSCVIITTDPNALMSRIHDRMPVILPADAYDLWLDPEFEGKDKLLSLLQPYPPEDMTVSPVSRYVNNARNEGPECLEAAT